MKEKKLSNYCVYNPEGDDIDLYVYEVETLITLIKSDLDNHHSCYVQDKEILKSLLEVFEHNG